MSGETYRLSFPASLDESSVVTALAGLAHDLYQRRAPRPIIYLSLIATQDHLHHELVVADYFVDSVLGRLRSCIPSLRVEHIDQPKQHSAPRLVTELRLTNLHRPLRMDRSAATACALKKRTVLPEMFNQMVDHSANARRGFARFAMDDMNRQWRRLELFKHQLKLTRFKVRRDHI